MFKQILSTAALMAGLTIGATAQAEVIAFSGGVVTGTQGNVTQYVEQGYLIQLIGGSGGHVGDYYSAGNDVIHAHWATGDYGQLTRIQVTKVDGTAFDLNYFVLTSNTSTGGGASSGAEQAYIHASADGVTVDYSQLLPPENWGFPATQVFLGSQFDNIKSFWFDVANVVDCFGMDNFFINEAAPGTVPEPGSMGLALSSLAGLALVRRLRRRRG